MSNIPLRHLLNTDGIAERLRTGRGNYTREFMAVQLGKCVKTIKRWETGQYAPDLANTKLWAEITGSDAYWMITGVKTPIFWL